MRPPVALAALVALAAQAPDPVRFMGTPRQGALLRGEADASVLALALRLPGAADVPVSLDHGRFLLGFDRDAPATAELIETMVDGAQRVAPLQVAPGAWRIERVDAPYHPPGFDARRPAELARIAAARTGDTGERGWQQPLRWPVTGPVAGPVRGRFGAQRIYRGTPGSYHAGVDIAAGTGTTVRAPAAGRVTLAADPPFTLEGRLVIIDHGGGLHSALMHLSRIDVAEGQEVAPGEAIGAVGATGRATGPHLHWGLTWRGARLDPTTAVEAPIHP